MEISRLEICVTLQWFRSKSKTCGGQRQERFQKLVRARQKNASDKKTLFTLHPTKTLFLEMFLPWLIRMGTPALTSRCFVEEDFAKAVKLALKVKSEAQAGTKMKDFVLAMESSSTIQSEIAKLRHEVEEFAMQFPTIGFEN
ncbi:BnaC07g51260D [Brassica napus]|uniref:BnaC07g51260D protein n=1 Tax=Brassica napus TaxID=3708 RepID=A0A078JCB8_BRANA|nr:BnaC07g51260D [Brassica napus]